MSSITIISRPNQTALDIAIMACGTMEGAMQLMLANETSISYYVYTNTEFKIPEGLQADAATLNYLRQNNIVIGTYLGGI